MFGFSSKSDSPPSATDAKPIRASKRKDCYVARDAFFKCMDEKQKQDKEASSKILTDEEKQKTCPQEWKRLNRMCPQAWIKYFEENRLYELKKQQYMDKHDEEFRKKKEKIGAV